MPEPKDLLFLTGADESYFWQILLLDESIRRNSPGVALLVCDFGFTDAQKRFLRARNMLLDRPDPSGQNASHPWYFKAMLGRYAAPWRDTPLVWLDVDLIAMADLQVLSRALCADMRQAGSRIAVTGRQNYSIGEWLATNDTAPGFAAQAAALDPAFPYVSSGLFLCRDPGLLSDWDAFCQDLPYEFLFEQNAFNLAVWQKPDLVQLLDPALWNVCGQDIAAAPYTFTLDGGPVLQSATGRAHILHATSTDRAADLLKINLTVNVEDQRCVIPYRIVSHPPDLRAYQDKLLLNALIRTGPDLIAAGCLAECQNT
jgi:hypothetical protein